MYQIDNSTAAATQPASTAQGTPGFFTDGNAAAGVAATIVPGEWLNAVQQELINVVEAGGLTPTKNLFNQVLNAIKGIAQAGASNYGVDSGTANAYAVTYIPTINTIADGLKLRFRVSHSNTGASTFSPNGLASQPIVGQAHVALQGGELVDGGDAEVVYNSVLDAWILLEQTGGGLQVAPATASDHALQLGQATGRLLNIQKFTASGTYTPTPGTNNIRVRAIAGGGGGGGVPASGAGQAGISSGGTAGSYCEAWMPNPGTQTVTIGAAGAAGAAGANAGGNGGNTLLGSIISLIGGNGGRAGGLGTPPFLIQPPSATTGSTVTSGTTLVLCSGIAGGPAIALTPSFFNGGGGGSSPICAGQTLASGAGTVGSGPGAGGSGGAIGASAAAVAGAAGLAGEMIIEEFA